MVFLFSGLGMSLMGMAQISASDFFVGAAGNYTMYKGSFDKSTPGVKLEAGYHVAEKAAIALGFTKGFAINQASTIASYDENGNTKTTPSNLKVSFSTVSLTALYRFVGNEESAVSVYAPVGGSYIVATVKEKATEALPSGYTAADQVESAKEDGFAINLGLGVGYKIGLPQIFAEGGIALPANRVGNSYVENYIPAHYTFNAGIRIPFGRSEEYQLQLKMHTGGHLFDCPSAFS